MVGSRNSSRDQVAPLVPDGTSELRFVHTSQLVAVRPAQVTPGRQDLPGRGWANMNFPQKTRRRVGSFVIGHPISDVRRAAVDG